MRRNEVASVISTRNVQQAMADAVGDLGLYIEDDRQQRAGLFLRDVAYRVHADMEVREDRSDAQPPQKFFSIFERRATNGQCVNQPYLGCREFDARVRLVASTDEVAPPIAETRDMGWMLRDMDFTNPADPQAMFFRAQLTNGVIDVPEQEGAR